MKFTKVQLFVLSWFYPILIDNRTVFFVFVFCQFYESYEDVTNTKQKTCLNVKINTILEYHLLTKLSIPFTLNIVSNDSYPQFKTYVKFKVCISPPYVSLSKNQTSAIILMHTDWTINERFITVKYISITCKMCLSEIIIKLKISWIFSQVNYHYSF